MNNAKKDELLVFGFCRIATNEMKDITLPSELIQMFFVWFHEKYQILKWSQKYRTMESMSLSDDDRCVTRKASTDNTYQWIICDAEPVYDGVHCWRLKQNNPTKSKSGWINYGVAARRMYTDNAFAPPTVWGIANNDCWYGGMDGRKHYHSYETYQEYRNDAWVYGFAENNIEIDILLDADKGSVQFVVVGTLGKMMTARNGKKKTGEAIMCQLPTNTDHGWVPYINTFTSSQGCELRICKVPADWYGHHREGLEWTAPE